jgi:chemotaxis protein CheX
MNVRYINPCVNSIGRVFMTMRWVDITFGIPRLDAFEGIRPDVSEMIGFSGDASGSVVPSFPKLVAVKDVSQFAGAELDVSHEDFADAVGELANMAAGGAKAEFDGLDVSNGLSSVITGEGHEVSPSNAHPQLIIPVKTPFDSFHVCVTMKIEKPAMAGAAS